jgi:hypothetical protein
MNLSKLVVELRFPSSVPDVFKFREKVLSGFIKDIGKVPNTNDGIDFLIKSRLLKVFAQTTRAGAEIVIPTSHQYAIDNILKVLKQLSNNLQLTQIDRIGVRSFWITSSDKSIDDLVSNYKTSFYNSKIHLISGAKDLALVLSLTDRERKINYNSGPLEKSQLLSILDVNNNKYGEEATRIINLLPNRGILVDFDYFLEKKQKYSTDLLNSFMREAVNIGRQIADDTIKQIKI